MYIRTLAPAVHFECIDPDNRLWLANLGAGKRLVKHDEQGLFTLSIPDNLRLDIELTDVLSCIPKANYNALVECLP